MSERLAYDQIETLVSEATTVGEVRDIQKRAWERYRTDRAGDKEARAMSDWWFERTVKALPGNYDALKAIHDQAERELDDEMAERRRTVAAGLYDARCDAIEPRPTGPVIVLGGEDDE